MTHKYYAPPHKIKSSWRPEARALCTPYLQAYLFGKCCILLVKTFRKSVAYHNVRHIFLVCTCRGSVAYRNECRREATGCRLDDDGYGTSSQPPVSAKTWRRFPPRAVCRSGLATRLPAQHSNKWCSDFQSQLYLTPGTRSRVPSNTYVPDHHKTFISVT